MSSFDFHYLMSCNCSKLKLILMDLSLRSALSFSRKQSNKLLEFLQKQA